MIKIALCDDETYMLDDIEARLLNYMDSNKLACRIDRFSDGQELLKSNESYDLLFLDIQMNTLDGLALAKQIRQNGFSGIIIFITVLKEYVFDAFEVEAYDYLLKPLDEQRFLRTMDRTLNALKQRFGKTVVIQKGNSCRILSFDEITYCEVLGRKVYLHTRTGETIDYYCRLEDLEHSVDSRFFRCHRSYLVNLDWVRGLKDGNVILADKKTLPVSRLREQNFTQAILSHMKERRR